MDRKNYIIVFLLLLTWLIEDIYHLWPSGQKISPFLYSIMKTTKQSHVFMICVYSQSILYGISLLISNDIKLRQITKDVIIMSIVLKILSLGWYLLKYGNPHYHSEWIMVMTAAFLIFFTIEFKRWNGRNNISGIND